jgi:hypothetical protein
MKRIKMSLHYRGLDPSGKVVFGTKVVSNLTSNSQLPISAALVPQLTSAINDLDAAIKAPNPNTTTIKAKVVQLEKVLYVIKAQVELECNDDEEIAVNSGFDLATPRSAKSKIFTVNLQCVFIRNAAYVWEQISDPINTNTWVQIGITNTTNLAVANLVAGNKYWFRAKAIVKDVQQAYSDPYMIHVI